MQLNPYWPRPDSNGQIPTQGHNIYKSLQFTKGDSNEEKSLSLNDSVFCK